MTHYLSKIYRDLRSLNIFRTFALFRKLFFLYY